LAKRERKVGWFRGWTKRLTLRQRILAVNIFAIGILFGGIFYLDSFRTRLTQARIDQAESEAVMIAHMMAAVPPGAREPILIRLGRDSGTRWTVDGRGNFWSRYRGFDFDEDGIGDAPHPLLGAFERLEGANPAARLFLQSPAAAGLELAARLSGRRSTDAVDDRPLVRRPPSPGGRPDAAARSSRPWPGLSLLTAFIAMALYRRGRC